MTSNGEGAMLAASFHIDFTVFFLSSQHEVDVISALINSYCTPMLRELQNQDTDVGQKFYWKYTVK